MFEIIALAIAAGVALISAAIASGDNAKAMAVRQGIADKYKDIPLPLLDRIVAQKLPPGSAERYEKATQATQAQGDVLGKYMEEVNQKGDTADDRAAYMRMRNEAAGISNDAQGAVQRNMQARGLGNSGMSFALQAQGAQSAVNRANQFGVQEASDARARYLQALDAAGNLSTNMRSQDHEKMRAQDQINQFNAQQQSNADMLNNKNKQDTFDNEMSRMNGEAAALNGVAANYERSAGATLQTGGAIGQAAITGGAALGAYNRNGKPRSNYGSPKGGDWI